MRRKSSLIGQAHGPHPKKLHCKASRAIRVSCTYRLNRSNLQTHAPFAHYARLHNENSTISSPLKNLGPAICASAHRSNRSLSAGRSRQEYSLTHIASPNPETQYQDRDLSEFSATAFEKAIRAPNPYHLILSPSNTGPNPHNGTQRLPKQYAPFFSPLTQANSHQRKYLFLRSTDAQWSAYCIPVTAA